MKRLLILLFLTGAVYADSPTGSSIGVQIGGTPAGAAPVVNCSTGVSCNIINGVLNVSASGGSVDPCSQSVASIPSGLHCATVTLSSADILNLPSTPKVLVPAAGAGNVVLPQCFKWSLHYVSHPYVGGPVVNAFWQNNANAMGTVTSLSQTFDFSDSSTPQSNASSYTCALASVMPGGTDSASWTNQPLVLQTSPGQTLNQGPALTVAIGSSAGTGYVSGDQFQSTVGEGDIAVFSVTTTGVGGAVTGVSLVSPGSENPAGSNQATANFGNVTSATVTTGMGGLVYANGDTGTISGCGSGTATYTVLTSTAGVVGTVSVSGGQNYTTMSGCTTTATTGTGTGLSLDVVSGSGSGLTVNVGVQAGDGSVTVTTWYLVVAE